MRINSPTDFTNLDDDESFKKYLTQFGTEAAKVINGNITLSDNISSQLVDVTFSAINTEVAVAHGLGKAPRGYFPVSQSVAMNIYDGSTANTADRLYLKSSVVGTAKIWVF